MHLSSHSTTMGIDKTETTVKVWCTVVDNVLASINKLLYTGLRSYSHRWLSTDR